MTDYDLHCGSKKHPLTPLYRRDIDKNNLRGERGFVELLYSNYSLCHRCVRRFPLEFRSEQNRILAHSYLERCKRSDSSRSSDSPVRLVEHLGDFE